jgi:hypothetical protein
MTWLHSVRIWAGPRVTCGVKAAISASLLAFLGLPSSSCSPITFGGHHGLRVAITLDSEEYAETRHFTLFGHTRASDLSFSSSLDAVATICRADTGAALGERLGVFRLVPDSPSRPLETLDIAGESECVSAWLGSYDCPIPFEYPSGAECGVTIEIERDEGADPIDLEVSVEIYGSLRAYGGRPDDFASGIREDA